MIPQHTHSGLPHNLKTFAVHCIRASSDAMSAQLVRTCLMEPSFDWPAFLDYIRRERVSPLIYYSIGKWGILPPEISQAIQNDYLQTVVKNVRCEEELCQVLPLLERAGIPTILLKGGALLFTLYDEEGLRPMADLDLLVPVEGFESAGHVLASYGYKEGLSSAIPADMVKEITYRKIDFEVLDIDLHCSLFNPPHEVSVEQLIWFWKNITISLREGVAFRTFNPTAQLLYLCAHLWLHHEGGNLLWQHDIDLLIRRHGPDIDWNEIIEISASFELLIPLKKILPELVGVWKTPVPETILLELARLETSVREQRKSGNSFTNNANYFEAFLNNMLSYPNWHSRLAYIRMIVLPPRRYIVERYRVRSPLLVPYFYAYRLVSTAIQQVRRMYF